VSVLGNPWLDLLLLVAAGIAAGVVNAMAGGGSFLILPVLVALGIPASTANGTTRVAVLAQNATSIATFHRAGIRDYGLVWRLLIPMVVGAGIGAHLATQIDDRLFRPLVGVVLLVWAVALAVKPGRFLHPPEHQRTPTSLSYVLALLVGLYGGFLQAGVGFPLIALLTGQLGYELVRANAVKVALVFAYTCVALPVFAAAGQVAWTPALVLTVGMVVGAYLGTRWQVSKGAGVVRWVVLAMVAVSGVMMLV
jgi:hypothetical protein